jgi:starch phosphorylase
VFRSATEKLQAFLQRRRVGYFSMEIALRSGIPTYAGGLGVLAGDTLRSAADLKIPLVGVTLVSREGYFRQSFDAAGRQVESPDSWQPEASAEPLPAKVSVAIDGREVWIAGWLYVVEGVTGGRQPVVLLDTDLPENAPQDRLITHFLYGGDAAYRLAQEIVLGIGGVRMLDALGFKIDAYHLNEGHSALLALELLRRSEPDPEVLRPGEPRYDVQHVRTKCHFTTHTPVEAGHDRFHYDLVARMLGEFVEGDTLRRLAGANELNTTLLALNLSEYVNGVASRHAKTAERMFPGYRVGAIANGVHPHTWAHPKIAQLYDVHFPEWCCEPELLMRADIVLADDDVLHAHGEAKLELIARVAAEGGVAHTMETALSMVAGSDVWLNTPQPPLEASGTSGMKAALNGVPSLSVLDGWWVDGHVEGVTGWAIDDGTAGGHDTAASLYDKLEHVVLPLVGEPERWAKVMKGAIARNAALFHSHRMMRRYAAEAYLVEAVL